MNHLLKVPLFHIENLAYLFTCLVWLRLGKKNPTRIQQASLQVVFCLAVHSTMKSLFAMLERELISQHNIHVQAVEGDVLQINCLEFQH